MADKAEKGVDLEKALDESLAELAKAASTGNEEQTAVPSGTGSKGKQAPWEGSSGKGEGKHVRNKSGSESCDDKGDKDEDAKGDKKRDDDDDEYAKGDKPAFMKKNKKDEDEDEDDEKKDDEDAKGDKKGDDDEDAKGDKPAFMKKDKKDEDDDEKKDDEDEKGDKKEDEDEKSMREGHKAAAKNSLTKSETVSNAIEVSKFLREIVKAQADMIGELSFRTRRLEKSIESLGAALVKSQAASNDMIKSFGSDIVTLGRAPLPRKGMTDASAISKSFRGEGDEKVSLSKSQIADKLCELEMAGKIPMNTTTKFEATGELHKSFAALVHESK